MMEGASLEQKIKHTPGPWKVLATDSSVEVVAIREGSRLHAPICDLQADGFTAKEERTLADAALIAAAPEMLSALREANEIIYRETGCTSFAADQAIAKAEGRS